MSSVLITGVGGITPLGDDHDTITSNLKAEWSNVRRMGSVIKNVKTRYWSPCVGDLREATEARDLPRSVYTPGLGLSYVAILRALKDAGLDTGVFDSERTALVSAIGQAGIDGVSSMVNYQENRPSAFAILKAIPTAATGPLTSILNVRGPVHTVQHACASGVRTVTQAMDLIRLGKADVVVCVSAEKILYETMAGFDAMRALYRGDNPEHASAPFSKDRAGFTISEGAGCLIVESYEHWQERGGKFAWARCVGYADYSDGGELTNPTGDGARRCLASLQQQLDRQNLYPDVISAHATSTPNGDVAEAQAIYDVYGDRVPVTAFKRLTGHSVTASGTLEIWYSLLMMNHNFLVGNPVTTVDPEIAPIQLAEKADRHHVGLVVKTAFGFGGLNSVLGLQKYL